MNIVKKLIIKSYTKDYYFIKKDALETRWMKDSIRNEFTSYIRYMLSSLWLASYTAFFDFFINTAIMILIILYKGLVLFAFLLIYYLVNEFGLYY